MANIKEHFSFTVTIICLVVVMTAAFIFDGVWNRHKKREKENNPFLFLIWFDFRLWVSFISWSIQLLIKRQWQVDKLESLGEIRILK
ncbi:hypothetical protein MOB09_17950 [Bacillus vallismortis]|uniref:hypothetical protein n=1 Tax=Bacillus vallismortis TaxID=72361 RepID=UPI00227E9573|nr:hypothetical protein [Bacillus vallismortis]MCI4136676.1 hypothetical protein [Bacillus vallismortis]MCY7894868.1 hypothetical protein [Bacillus vallismortis]MCY8534946.1 hypothetical protein [Bacillus vallismortis]